MPDFISQWLNQNDIFTAMAILEYWNGLVTTVQLVFLSLLIGLVIALPLAILRTVRNPFVSGPIWVYTYLFRGTPLLIQLYIIYYGIAQIPGIQETFWWLIFREPFYPALLAFTLNTAAYTTEIIRGAIIATPMGEIEAAKAYGMSWMLRMRRIILPNAARRAVQAYSNEVIFMLHASAIASVVTMVDLTGAARNIYARTYAPFDAFIFVALIYLMLTFILVFVFRKLENHLLRHQRPAKS
ncbi:MULTISPECIES: ABC transporter permease [unclassified Marinobacter]|jgi:arginine/ornithine transport system permease protein|uniref:ABC transporter permease n=1 Tax=unclassified Marinobacter TaxID=83889 RepID=UPI00200CFD9A|nr:MULTISPECIES: ABC transporter permease [unclassified Marinobacter]MCL1478456.1 ABC transporter permease [Marinobacter sp.]MCL1480414.1 ABC transporter permease [Marinobacter sp.]UQG55393.1 ABC transporter permease [Marinobacter sp. M4C]UQG64197.1 ABC transporter permease [Marinobacter sp. M2C]UQG68476.1 ABC transporter permease [Marinobacter sp. M1C]